MKLTATCPTCGAELELEDIAPGTAVECPACNHALTVPDPPAARVAEPKKRLRLPSRQATASAAPVYIPVPAKPRGIIGGAFHGCGVLLVMALILVVVIIGCNALVLGGAASALKEAREERDRTPAWKVVRTSAAGESVNAVVGEDRTGSICIVGPIVKLETTQNIDPARTEWSAPLVAGAGRDLRRYAWTKTAARVAVLKLVDEGGETDMRRGETFVRDILALDDTDSIAIAYPGAAINHVIMVRVRGLRDALAEAGYDLSGL